MKISFLTTNEYDFLSITIGFIFIKISLFSKKGDLL